MRTLLVICVLAMVPVGCGGRTSSSGSSASTVAAAVAPVGFHAVTISITHEDGSVERRCVWLADDAASRERGLMGVTDPALGGRVGMVFSFPADTTTSFWMKDTPLPLSIAWFDAAGGFISATDMEPCPSTTANCPTYPAARPYRLALEVPMGGLATLGIDERAKVSLSSSCD